MSGDAAEHQCRSFDGPYGATDRPTYLNPCGCRERPRTSLLDRPVASRGGPFLFPGGGADAPTDAHPSPTPKARLTGGRFSCPRRTHDLLHPLARCPEGRLALGELLPAEIACRGTGKLLVNEAALDKLQALRDRLGKPLIVRSAYCSPEHNRAVGGATLSKHLDGAAFDGAGRFVAAVLRPAKRPKGREIAAHLRRLIRAIRAHWPRVEILLRGDGHYCAPEVLHLCRTRGVDFVFGLPTTSVLRRHVATLEASTTARAAAAEGGAVRRFKEFHDAAASWSRVERIVARVEAGPRGCDTRFVVTSLTRGTGKVIYEKLYCARGQAENHIKAWKAHLAADRTSCTSAAANQLRLFLHAGAYWLMWTLRAALPRRSPWRRAQFDTLRLRLIKIAARVVEMKTRVTVHLPSACPAAPIMRLLLERLPRMAPI